MKTRNEMIAEALARRESQPGAKPTTVAYVSYSREELLSVLAATQPANAKCRALVAGATNAGAGSQITVVREDLLTALGADYETHDRERAAAEAKRLADAQASERAVKDAAPATDEENHARTKPNQPEKPAGGAEVS